MRIILTFAGLAALAACAPTSQDPAGLPLARAELAPGAAVAAAGEARIPVTVVAARDGSVATPVSASCVAEGSSFTASFSAPAELAVPSFGSASQPVRIVCEAGGLRGVRVAQPMLRSQNGIGGWPAVGVGVGTGGGSYVSVGGFWNGGWGGGPDTVSVRYPAVEIVLE